MTPDREAIRPDFYYTIRQLTYRNSPTYTVSSATFFRHMKEGRIQVSRVGRKVLIKGADFLAYLKGEKATATSSLNEAGTKPEDHPGRLIKDEMEARGWSVEALCRQTGMEMTALEEIIAGSRRITPVFAMQFGEAFGTGVEFWNNLQARYSNAVVEPLFKRPLMEAPPPHGENF